MTKNIKNLSSGKITKNIKRYEPEGNVNIGRDSDCQLFINYEKAGFPSPGYEELAELLNLNHHMVKNASATFFFKVSGRDLADFGIFDGDLLVVDRTCEVYNGSIVIVRVDDQWTVKKFVRKQEKTLLVPAINKFERIDVTGREFVLIWGVITYTIHKSQIDF